MQGRTWHPQLLHPGHVQWVPSTLSPAPAAGEGSTHTHTRQHHVPVGWGRTEQDGMEEPPLFPGATSGSHPPASPSACSSRARLPPRNTPSASPTATRSHPLGTKPSLGPGTASSLGAAASGAATATPSPPRAGVSTCCVPSHPDRGAGKQVPPPLHCCCCWGTPHSKDPQGTQGKKQHPGLGCPAEGRRVLQPWRFKAMALTPIPSFTCGTVGHPCLAQLLP